MSQSHPKLRKAVSMMSMSKEPQERWNALKTVIWELMKCQTQVNNMDKQIKKVQKDVAKKDLPKAKKDLASLAKKDKVQDKKIAKCGAKASMKKKAKKK